MALCLFMACSNDNEKKEEKNTSSNLHTYHINIANGKTYQGNIPKVSGGVYNPVSIVEYSQAIDSKVMTGTLMDTGKFQIGIGIALDENYKPSLKGSGPGIAFGQWGVEDKYSPSGTIDITLKNYEEHNISMYGEDGKVASCTLNFSGKFKLGADGEQVNVTGEIVMAAP